jgi:hypothetical protein
MRRVLLSVFAVVFAALLVSPLMAQGAPPQAGADQPYTARPLVIHRPRSAKPMERRHFPQMRLSPRRGSGSTSLV